MVKVNILSFIFLLSCPLVVFSQDKNGWGGEAAMYGSHYGTFMGHVSINHNWMINKFLSFSLGGMFMYTRIDDLAGWETPDASYYLENESIKSINLLSRVTCMLPLFKKTGIYASGSAFAELLPFDYISIEKSTNREFKTESKGKFTFTKFSPGVFVDVGIYHDFVRENNILKIFLGVGYGWYDPLSGYRNCKIYDQDLSTKLPRNNNFFRVTIKIMGF